MSNPGRLKLKMKSPHEAEPVAQAVLLGAQLQMGMIPNMYGFMANSPGLLDTYRVGYDHFRKHSGFLAVEQEVILLSISYDNGCEYCVAAHSIVADMYSFIPPEVTNAIRAGTAIPDPTLAALSDFTHVMVKTGGRPSEADLGNFWAAGYSESQVLEVILAIGVKTLSNYTNHVCHTPLDPAFSSRVWSRPNAD